MSPQPHLQQLDLVGITPGVDEAVYLIGRPPIGEDLGFMDQTLEGAATSREQLMDPWRAANGSHSHAGTYRGWCRRRRRDDRHSGSGDRESEGAGRRPGRSSLVSGRADRDSDGRT
jgi:hypothetical protein